MVGSKAKKRPCRNARTECRGSGKAEVAQVRSQSFVKISASTATGAATARTLVRGSLPSGRALGLGFETPDFNTRLLRHRIRQIIVHLVSNYVGAADETKSCFRYCGSHPLRSCGGFGSESSFRASVSCDDWRQVRLHGR